MDFFLAEGLCQGQKDGRSRLDTALHKFYLDFVVFEARNS